MENRHFITKDYPKEIDFPVSDTWLRHYQDYFKEDKERKEYKS